MTTDLDVLITRLRNVAATVTVIRSGLYEQAADALEQSQADLRQERERADEAEAYASHALADRAEAVASLSRAEETIEKVRAWTLVPRYKVSGDHDTFDTYHEGVDAAQGEASALITEYDKQKGQAE